MVSDFNSAPPSYLECQVAMPPHIVEYLQGDGYAKTPDFMFQELVRTSDIALRDLVKDVFGWDKAEEFRSSGWGQLISAAYLLEQTQDQLKISDAFRTIVVDNLTKALTQAATKDNPISSFNVRGFTKAIIMNSTHPTKPCQYLGWEPIPAPHVVDQLTALIADTQPELRLYHGAILLIVKPEGDAGIFNQLWNTDFAKELERFGYSGLQKPLLTPHLTLVNSDQIQKIKDSFNGNDAAYTAYMNEALAAANASLQQHKDYLSFTELCYTFSFEFPTYTDVVVANVRSSSIDNEMKAFSDKVMHDLGIVVTAKPVEDFHLTVAGKFREPTPYLKDKKVEWIIDRTGKYAEQLQAYWNSHKA